MKKVGNKIKNVIWVSPIYDRNESDISFAKQKLREWRLNPPAEYVDLKGMYNVSDLVRVENNSQFLMDLLNEKGYQIDITTKLNWSYNDTPIQSDLTRVINNINAIHIAFPIDDFVVLPTTIRTYEQANIIEEALAKLYFYVDYIVYHYCDTFNSGSNFFLPLGGISQ